MRPTVNSQGRHYEEKRNFIRMDVNADATVTRRGGHTVNGLCHNLSGGGALLELEEPEQLNTQLEFTIHSPHGHAPVFNAKGNVVRSILDAEKQRYLVAIAY